MEETFAIGDVPSRPAVYAMYAGGLDRLYVAYVGVSESLRPRLRQHLVSRSSSVVIGAAAVSLNPQLIREVRWWEHADFGRRHVLEAAELVAFDVLEPVLRSRGAIQAAARQLYADEGFARTMGALLASKPSGRLTIPSPLDALGRIDDLERRVAILEQKLAGTIGEDARKLP